MILLSLFLSWQVSAVEPINPEALCDRFIKPTEREACVKRARTMDLDWYAVSVCHMVDDDDVFNDCWKKISGRAYSPAALEACAVDGLEDPARVACLTKAAAARSASRSPASSGGKRSPAAKPVYQPLKIGK